MNRSSVALVGISNAIVDVLCHVQPEFIQDLGAPPGSMTLIDRDQAVSLYERMGPAVESAGGSVANTVACFASLGGSAGYVGRVAEDQLGRIFEHDMTSIGVDTRLKPETREAPTARCHVLITPDGERTMQTYLGACVEIAPSDITEASCGDAQIVLLEGYVWDTPEGPESMAAAVRIAKANGHRVALSLSDSFCVERHHAAFSTLSNAGADIVIGNEAEMKALFEVATFDEARAAAAANGRLFVMTRSELGSVIIQGSDAAEQAADTIEQVIDSTGAGDAYVAGCLFALSQGQTLSQAAKLGTNCASLAIQQVGARPQPAALRALVS
ncbi:MAG: adenosine kinase [Pseudomonadota bacterium]